METEKNTPSLLLFLASELLHRPDEPAGVADKEGGVWLRPF
jgi:hypothetical protein